MIPLEPLTAQRICTQKAKARSSTTMFDTAHSMKLTSIPGIFLCNNSDLKVSWFQVRTDDLLQSQNGSLHVKHDNAENKGQRRSIRAMQMRLTSTACCKVMSGLALTRFSRELFASCSLGPALHALKPI